MGDYISQQPLFYFSFSWNERISQPSPEKLHLLLFPVFKVAATAPSVLLSLRFSPTKKELVFFNGRLPSNASLRDYSLSYMVFEVHYSMSFPEHSALFLDSSSLLVAVTCICVSLIHPLYANNTHLLILRTDFFSFFTRHVCQTCDLTRCICDPAARSACSAAAVSADRPYS